MKPLITALTLLAPVLAIASAAAQTNTKASARYAACIEMAHNNPAKGLERARTWQDTGGGDPARHCEGVALISLGRYRDAGRLLENLARTMKPQRQAAMRAKALGQAGQAWLLAGNPGRAEAAYGAALDLRNQDVELWIDRALARFEMGRYWEAIDDLNQASEIAPARADILVYRASAYRHVEAPTMARSDIKAALKRNPDHLEGLLERGILRRLNGNKNGARADWLRILDLAPDSPAADAARENLAKLDVKGAKPAAAE